MVIFFLQRQKATPSDRTLPFTEKKYEMPRKRGDDSDDDVPPPSSNTKANPPNNKKGGKKGNKGDDDEEVEQLTKTVKKLEIKENNNSNDKGNNNKGGNNKGKSKKGRRGGDDSDDDDNDSDTKPAANNKGKGNNNNTTNPPPSTGKKNIPKNSNEDDENNDEDNDADDQPYKKPSGSTTAPGKSTTQPVPSNTKKGGKNKKGKGKRGDSDDDDDDDDDNNVGLLALPSVQKGNRLKSLKDDSSDDEPKQKTKKKDKKNKGNNNNNKNQQDDDDNEDEKDDEEQTATKVPSESPVNEEISPEPSPTPVPEPEPTPLPTTKITMATEETEGDLIFAGKKKSKKNKKFEFTETNEADDTPVTVTATAIPPEETITTIMPTTETTENTVSEGNIAAEFGEKKKKKKKKGFDLNIEEILPEDNNDTPVTAQKVGTVIASSDTKSKPASAHTNASNVNSNVATTHSHSSTALPDSNQGMVFYGEATMGNKGSSNDSTTEGYTGKDMDGNPVGLDGEPVTKEIADALLKQFRGDDLSNRVRRIVKEYEEDRAKRGPLKAGGSLTVDGDDYGLNNFSLSQAGKADNLTVSNDNSKDIAIDNFSISAHKKILFDSANLRIAHGRRYGLVGPNGQGKSTLLKHMAARQLSIPSRIDMLYVEQEVVADDTPAYESVLKADKKRATLKEEAEKIEKELDIIYAKDPNGLTENSRRDAIEDRLNEVFEEMASMKTEASEGAARSILHLLGFNQRMQETPTKNFSGGWRMRISLARALFMQPDLLLLDEPTNHLDLNAVIGLEYHLQHRFRGTLLVVSHDQDFLSTVVDEIIHLEDKRLYYYKGSYDDFKAAHEQKVDKQQKDYDKQQKSLQMAKSKGKSSKEAEAIEKSRAKRMGATAKSDKKAAISNAGGSSSSDLPSMNGLIVRPKEYVVYFKLNDPPELAPPILSINNVSFRYNDNSPYLFKKLSFGIDQSSRIAIVGPNGVGKSTLLNLMIGELNPSEGEIVRNRFLKVGKYSQHFVDVLPMDKSPVQFIQSRFPDVKYGDARALLGRFGLEGHAHEIESRNLSGGQKARVVFASLCLEAPHIMVLDEPTNNLDIESIDALGDAIREYQGGVVLVSHDARLIRNAECELWVCDNQTVAPFDGDIDDYRDSLIKDIEAGDEEILREAERKAAEEEEARMAALRERIRLRKAAQNTGGQNSNV